MSYLNGRSLQVWKKGDSLQATDLNANFAVLADRAETAMTQALMPDPAAVGLEMRLGRLEKRFAVLEQLAAMHERQRNEKEWAPLSHLGAVLQRVANLQTAVEDAVKRIDEAHSEIRRMHGGHHQRLSRLEQRPEAATAEEHNQLAALHADTRDRARTALVQAIALRHEVEVLRKLATGHDRNANRLEFAPLSTVAHLLQRVMEIEKRLDGRSSS